ncbi:Mysoin-binding motif of peroxisomes-domain-containing protein [Pilobolus umbonatus]|nr:Mysoin-binding motif of peroxisomes-domain-containing protein [Pilobolus umbonatus]
MAEIVVYEDSPLADYLQSVDKQETTTKVAPSLTIDTNRGIHSKINIRKIWGHSVFYDAFSISLSRAEETAFEEKFKYLIVTSPLLNEELSVHNYKRKNRLSSTELPFQSTRTTKLGVTTNLVTTLAVILGAEKYMVQSRIPIFSLLLSSSASLFFLYRHKRRTSIRQLYQVALSRIQAFTEHSDAFDNKVHRILITIQEIELVSRGYRLSTPLSPISRIEQNSKSRQCIQLRNKLASVLRRAFITYEEGIIDLMDVTNKSSLSTLYEMYNVNSIASLSAMGADDGETYDLGQLKKLAQIMHLKRRECLVQFLALGVMTDGHDSVRFDYQEGWRTVNDVLGKLVNATEKFTKDVTDALDIEFYKPINEFQNINSSTKISDERLKKFVHRLSSIEQQLRTMEAKIYLCSEDVRQLNSEPASSGEIRQKLLNEYLSVQKGFENMSLEWENGREVLKSFLDPPVSLPSSPIQSPIEKHEELSMDETEGKGIILDSEDVADILNLPQAAKASVYEAVAGVVEKNSKDRAKKSRKERIEEMKRQRAKETEDRSTQLDSQTMFHELKNVLHKRLTDLELQQ